MDAVIKVILREIQLECQRQIGIERKGGRAIKEEEIEPYPERCDFDSAVLPEQTLVQLVESTESESPDPQMTVDEAIGNAEKATTFEEKVLERSSPRNKFEAWLEAIRDWHFSRKEKEYTYECAKQRAEDRTYGFEYISDFIDEYIKRLEKDESSNANGQVF